MFCITHRCIITYPRTPPLYVFYFYFNIFGTNINCSLVHTREVPGTEGLYGDLLPYFLAYLFIIVGVTLFQHLSSLNFLLYSISVQLLRPSLWPSLNLTDCWMPQQLPDNTVTPLEIPPLWTFVVWEVLKAKI